MRSLSIKNILIVAIPAAIVVLLALTLLITGKPEKTIVVLEPNYVVYDEYDNKYVTSSEIEVDSYWNGDKVIQVEGEDVVLGDISAGIESSNQSATVLTDAVVVMPDNSFKSIDAGTKITNAGDSYLIGEETVPAGTIIKTSDRRYLILGDVVSEEGVTYSSFMSVCLDKTGAPTFATSEEIFRSSQTAVLTLANGAKFDVSAETVTLEDGAIIDLKEIGGSTSEYESLTNEPVEPKEEQTEEESSQNEDSSNEDTNSSTQPTTESSNQSNSGSTSQSNSGSTSQSNSGGSGGGESFTITEDMYAFLFEKTPPTGNIMGVTDITPVSATVNLNVYDSSDALVGSPQIVVAEQATGEIVYSTTIDSNSIEITSLLPNTKYSVQLVASYDIGDGIEKRALDTATFETPSITANFSVELLTKESAEIRVNVENNVVLEGGYILVESGDGYSWSEEQQVPFDSEAAAEDGTTVTIDNLSQNTMYRISIVGASYYGVDVPVTGEAVFTTLKDSANSFSYEMVVDKNNVNLQVNTEEPDNYMYEYEIIDEVSGETSSYLIDDNSNANFNLATGLVPNTQYYANVTVYEEDVEVSTYESSIFTIETDIEITNMEYNDGKTIISFSGIPYASNDISITLNYIGEDGEKKAVSTVEASRRLENEITINMPLPTGMYTIEYTDGSGTMLESEQFAYNASEEQIFKIVDEKIYTYYDRKIVVYDATNFEVVEEINVRDNKAIEVNTEIVEIYSASEVVFLLDNESNIYVFSDEDELYADINGTNIQEVVEKNDALYIVINESEVIEIK